LTPKPRIVRVERASPIKYPDIEKQITCGGVVVERPIQSNDNLTVPAMTNEIALAWTEDDGIVGSNVFCEVGAEIVRPARGSGQIERGP
jgi:hypothetical protein